MPDGEGERGREAGPPPVEQQQEAEEEEQVIVAERDVLDAEREVGADDLCGGLGDGLQPHRVAVMIDQPGGDLPVRVLDPHHELRAVEPVRAERRAPHAALAAEPGPQGHATFDRLGPRRGEVATAVGEPGRRGAGRALGARVAERERDAIGPLGHVQDPEGERVRGREGGGQRDPERERQPERSHGARSTP